MTDKKYGRGESEAGGFTYRTLMLAGMHFMDSYNYDVERVKRCVIHYAAPNGLIYPFCAYNSGPVYRERIERILHPVRDAGRDAPPDRSGKAGLRHLRQRARTGRLAASRWIPNGHLAQAIPTPITDVGNSERNVMRQNVKRSQIGRRRPTGNWLNSRYC